jgi:hypothetical protein
LAGGPLPLRIGPDEKKTTSQERHHGIEADLQANSRAPGCEDRPQVRHRRPSPQLQSLEPRNLKAVRAEVANFKRFRKLVDQWADAALKLSRLKTRLGLYSDES